MLALSSVLAIWMNIYEQKCMYYTQKEEKDQITFSYNTREPVLDQRGQRTEIPYLLVVIDPSGQEFLRKEFIGEDKIMIETEHPGPYILCVELFIGEEDREKKLREQKRHSKRVDIRIESAAELKAEQSKTKDATVQKASRLANKVAAAKSQQDGSQYRRTVVESNLNSLGFQYKLLTILSVLVFLGLSTLASQRIKRYLKELRM